VTGPGQSAPGFPGISAGIHIRPEGMNAFTNDASTFSSPASNSAESLREAALNEKTHKDTDNFLVTVGHDLVKTPKFRN
jgi:hypothetical protein